MLLVIFGAGASYDSAPSYPAGASTLNSAEEEFRPPLANQLFENRTYFADALTYVPQALALVPTLRHLPPNESLEHLLGQYLSQADGYPERHKQIMAVRFYLQLIIHESDRRWQTVHKGVTNYKTLLDAIERWRYHHGEKVCFVTFNYDTMLETALGVEVRKLDDYIADENHKVIKVHGSVNWGRYIETTISAVATRHEWRVAEELIQKAAELRASDNYTILNSRPGTLADSPDNPRVVIPAIAIPIENKGEFVCPPKHVKVLEECLQHVTKILIVGWRATESHFLHLLRTKLGKRPHLMILAKDHDEARYIGDKLINGGIGAGLHTARHGFSNEIRVDHDIEAFLWKEVGKATVT